MAFFGNDRGFAQILSAPHLLANCGSFGQCVLVPQIAFNVIV